MIERLAIACMGTRFELVLVGPDRGHLRAAGEEALAEIEALDARLSRFRRDSLLSHINRSAALGPVAVDDEFFGYLETCDQVWRESRGAFDPSVGAWMETENSGVRESRDLKSVGWNAVQLSAAGARVQFGHPGVALDLGAIGKGIALDRAADVLIDAGVSRALLHGGTSTALALGPPHDGEAWTVALGREAGAPRVALCQRALSVSAPRTGTDPCAHVLDPRSGEPASQLARAAVLAPSATLADAWSTALLVTADGSGLPSDLSWACARQTPSHLDWTLSPESPTPFRSAETLVSAP